MSAVSGRPACQIIADLLALVPAANGDEAQKLCEELFKRGSDVAYGIYAEGRDDSEDDR